MYNVFSTTDAQRCGIHPEQIRRAIGCCIERLGHGVYVLRRTCQQPRHKRLHYRITHEVLVLPPVDPNSDKASEDLRDWWERDLTDHLGLLAATTLISGDVVSHHSAARVWGLPLLPRSSKRIEVSHPDKRHVSKHIHRRQRSLPDSAFASQQDFLNAFAARSDDLIGPADLKITVTTLERTVVDICRDCPLQEAVMVADAYIGGAIDPAMIPGAAQARRSSSTRRAMVFSSSGELVEFPLPSEQRENRKQRLIAVAAQEPFARGNRQFHTVMAICHGLSESPAESLANLGFYELGLEVEQQFRVDDADGLVGWADFRIKGTNLLFEVDGAGKYRNQEQPTQADMTKLAAEKNRTDRMHRRGFHTERGGYHDVSKPDRFGPLIWRAVRAARAA